MAMMLDCQIDRDKAGTVITLPYAAVDRAYVLLDALLCGSLRTFVLRSGSTLLTCSCGDEDVLTEDTLTLSVTMAEYIKSVLLKVVLRPQDVDWLHADVNAAGGEAVIRFANP